MKQLLCRNELKGIGLMQFITAVSLLLFSSYSMAEENVIGEIIFSEGDNSLVEGGVTPRLLAVGDEVYTSDVVKTGNEGVVIIEYIDRAKITLRPKTSIFIKQYDFIQAKIFLAKGNIRVVTGKIAERNPKSFKVITADGIVEASSKKSDFTVSTCQVNCGEFSKTPTKRLNTSLPIIAKVIAMKGEVFITSKHKRRLFVGNAIYSTEAIASKNNSSVQLQFVDGSRLALPSNSKLVIDDYKYDQTGQRNRSVFSLFRGGMRYITGLMAKIDRRSFKLKTSVVTMGVRGTHYVIQICTSDCGGGTQGIVGTVMEGEISLVNNKGSFSIGTDGYFNVPSSNEPAFMMRNAPANLIATINQTDDLEKKRKSDKSIAGVQTERMVTSVDEGVVVVIDIDDKTTRVGAGKMSFIDSQGNGSKAIRTTIATNVADSSLVVSMGSVEAVKNTIEFGLADQIAGSNEDEATGAGTGAVITSLIQEMGAFSPYNY